LISSPVVESVIENGRAQITGNFSLKEAKILSDLLNSGALPVNLKLIGESIVNPIFSAEILNIALYGSILGIVLVFIFMVVFYGFYGLLADIALVFFLVFNLAFYKILGVTISLSSLSGLVLAVGMAVDANILIFERIKEESKRGLKMKDLIEEGFNRAFPSIRDSNMTTIISSLLMYYLATSFVKGFALTLLFGVIISFVTAVFFTKYLLELTIRINTDFKTYKSK
jgi:preprotein translocase subunit SecD